MTTPTTLDRAQLVAQADRVLAWIREQPSVTDFQLSLHEKYVMVSFNETVGAERLLGLVPWDELEHNANPRVRETDASDSSPILRSTWGTAFDGVSVSLYAWRLERLTVGSEHLDDADPVDSAVTLQVVGGVL